MAFISRSQPIHLPIDILGGVATGNVIYVLILFYQSRRYERKRLSGNVCCGCFNETVPTAAMVLLYGTAQILIVRDIWVNTGQDFGLSLFMLLISWVPSRLFCPFFEFTAEELVMYPSHMGLFNPRSLFMNSVRVVLAVMEIVCVCWFCAGLYVYAGGYRPHADLYHSVRITALVSTVVLCIGCNIWWMLAGLWAGSEQTVNSKLNERLISDDTFASQQQHEEDLQRKYEELHTLSELKLKFSLMFFWFTPTLKVGFQRLLQLSDLPNLPDTMSSTHNATLMSTEAQILANSCQSPFGGSSSPASQHKNWWAAESDTASHKRASSKLVSILWRCYGPKFIVLGIIKLLNVLASFAGPLVLGAMVTYIQTDAHVDTIGYGLFLVACMFLSFLISAILNTSNNVRGGCLQISVKAGLTKLVFARAMRLPLYAWSDVNVSDAKLTTLVQVDVDRVSDALKSLHDLWALPLQLGIAFYLLYDEVGFRRWK